MFGVYRLKISSFLHHELLQCMHEWLTASTVFLASKNSHCDLMGRPPNVVLLHPSGTIFYYWDLDIGTAFMFRDPPFPGNTDQCRKEQ